VFSPLLLAIIVGACCWLWYTLKPLMIIQHEESVLSEQVPIQPAHQSLAPAAPLLGTTHSQQLPETPLPPVYEGQLDSVQQESHEIQAAQPVPKEGSTNRGPGEHPYVLIRLLDKVSMEVQTADGSVRMSVPIPENALRTHLLARIAWLRGDRVGREKVLESVFGHGKDDEDASPVKLTTSFDSHRKFIRADLRTTIAKLNEEVGYEAIPPTLDIFANFQRNWWLAETCRVVDLDAVEAFYSVIDQAESTGQLATSIPEHVRDACESLIAAYPGDFMESLLRDHAEDFDPWTQSWARVPFTHYRDKLLRALWYAATYEMQSGQALGDQPDEEDLLRQNQHFDRAARHYRTCAMRACSSRFDTKVTFSRAGRGHGERVTMSERALRRCLMLYGTMGNTQMVDRVYSEYSKLMMRVSADAWRPEAETLADLEAARSRTSAYRLPAQVTPSVGSRTDDSSLQAAEHS
jgi:hypothetical protein